MDKTDEIQPQGQINIELGEKEAEGHYSNLAIISHSGAEFILDFTRIFPGIPKAKVHSRIIMTPQHCKMLLNLLKDNLDRYEASYGDIKLFNSGNDNAFGFQVPMKPTDEKVN